jgi:hypothetical protein
MLTDDEVKKLALRLPVELHTIISQLAKADRRSLHAELLVLLQEAINARETAVEDADPKNHAGQSKEWPAWHNIDSKAGTLLATPT